jgi:hypothetical protein
LLDGNTNPQILRASAVLKDAYIQVRAAKVREQVLTAILWRDYLKFESMNVSPTQYLQFQPGIYQQLVAQMQVFNLGT